MKDKILKEIADTVNSIEAKNYKLLASNLIKAKRVFIAGAGRSGLAGRFFAIRLRHLGIESYVAGDNPCPPIKKGDLLIAVSYTGNKKTVIPIAEKGREAGAKVLTITSDKDTPLTKLSNHTIQIPIKHSLQFSGSLFEQSALIFLDIFAEDFRRQQGISRSAMIKQHANLE